MSTKLTTGEEANRFIEKVREKYLSKSEVFNLQDKTVTENGEVKADSDYYGLDTVTVNVQPELEDKTITENGTYTSEKYGFNEVNVNVLPVMEPTTVISTGTEQIINPPSGTTGFSKVTVNPINLQDKNAVPNGNIQEIMADTGYSGLNKVTVSAIQTETATVKSTTAQQTITPSQGVTGFDEVVVNPISLQDKTVKSSSVALTISADNGYDGLNEITVSPLDLETKTVKSTTAEQTIQPTTGKDGISEITVEALNYQEKVVNPGTENQEITPDTGYDALSKVTVNGADIVPSLEYTYRNKSVITAEDLAGFTTIQRGIFQYAKNLVSIDIPSSVTTIESEFSGSTSLVHIGLPNRAISLWPGTFYFCTSLYDIDIPGTASINGSGMKIFTGTSIYKFTYNSMYGNKDMLEYNNNNLYSIRVAEGVTDLTHILYSNTEAIESYLYEVILPSTLTTISSCVIAPGSYSPFIKLVIPDNVTTINISSNYLIQHAGALRYISLPPNISTINLTSLTFNCPKFSTIYVRGNSSCTTANTLNNLTAAQLNNATIIYLEE